MNQKKCKQIRRELRQFTAGEDLPARGLMYKDTKKITGFRFPQGWTKERLQRLAVCGGPWYNEALQQMRPVFARIAVNVPASFRAMYRRAKRHLKNGS